MRVYRSFYSFLSFLLLSVISFPVSAQSSNNQAQPPDSGNATITVTVTGKDHRPVSGLKPEDFSLYVDGQRQTISAVISDVPACIGILVDRSGSMRGKHPAIASAMAAFTIAGNPGNRTFVVSFNDDPTLEQDFTADSALIERAIARSDARGGTAMYDAIIASTDHLAEAKDCRKRVLLVVSDGEDNDSKKSLEYTLAALQHAGNPLIYPFGLPHPNGRTRTSRRALEALADPSGGSVLRVDSPDELRKAAPRIAEEIRSQYLLTYAPAGAAAGSRNIKVEAHAAGQKELTVRANVTTRADLPAVAAATQTPGSDCISGSVVDEQKKPVANMLVEAWPAFSPNSYAKDSYPQNITDEKGKFKFSQLEPGVYLLYTSNEGAGYPSTKQSFYQNGAVPGTKADRKCTSVIVGVGPKAAKLRIHVVDATTGAPLPNFGISFRTPSGSPLVISHGSQEQEVMVPARTTLSVSAWSYGFPRSEPISISTPEPEASGDVTVKLSPRVASSAGNDQKTGDH